MAYFLRSLNEKLSFPLSSTNWLSTRRGVILRNLIVSYLVDNLPTYCGTESSLPCTPLHPLVRWTPSSSHSALFKIGFVEADFFPFTARSPVSVFHFSSVYHSHNHVCHIPRPTNLQQFYGPKNSWWSVQTKANLSFPTSWRRIW